MQVKSDHSSRWHRLHISPPRSRIIEPLSSTSTTAHRLCPGVITPAGADSSYPPGSVAWRFW